MRIEQLEYVIEISRRKSFNRASEYLHLTTQSLSRSITSMENEIGFKLFERSFQGVTFTAKGEIFLASAHKIVKEYRDMLARVTDSKAINDKLLEGELVIYANPLFHIQWLPEVLKKFCADNPLIRVSALEKDPQGIYKRLQQAEKDNDAVSRIGLVLMPYHRKGYFADMGRKNSIQFECLSKEPYYVYASRQSSLAELEEISIFEILAKPLVLFSSDEANITPVRFMLEQYGEIHVVFTASSFSLWLNAIKNDVGIGLFQDIFIHNAAQFDLSQVVKIRLKEDLFAMLGYLYWGECSKIEKLFIEYLPRIRGVLS